MKNEIHRHLLDLLSDPDRTAPALTALAERFSIMDGVYDEAAAHYGFQCRGCEDNCCRSRFYHHTLLEYIYLHKGFMALAPEVQRTVRQRADEVVRAMRDADARDAVFRRMCPANEDGRCLVYAHRPMICRMHGLPSRMMSPRGGVVEGQGCDDFHAQFPGPPAVRFDRTPHYQAVAELERTLRREVGWEGGIKMTVAEIILTFPSEE